MVKEYDAKYFSKECAKTLKVKWSEDFHQDFLKVCKEIKDTKIAIIEP
jgi:hypothetical protein